MKRRTTTLALLGAIIVGIFMTMPGFAGVKGESKKGEKTDTISVPEMQCGMCEGRIEKVLKKISGVTSVSADADANTVVVTYNPSKTSLGILEQAIADVGYDAGEKKTTEGAQGKLSGCCKPGAHD